MSIYFDNAAGSHPKPEAVYQSADRFLRQGGNPGRSAHKLAVDASKEVFESRLKIAEFLGVKSPDRLIFTPGCTQSINMALRGMRLVKDDCVLVSSLEHNALMRPLYQLQKTDGIKVETVPYQPGQIIDLQTLEKAIIEHRPKLCAFLEASNVTGELLPIQEVAETCEKHGIPLLIDAAQSAGHLEARLDSLPLTFWCASGHKGLLGSPGIGLLYVNPNIDIEPLVCGGTGSRSEQLEMPAAYPDHLEAGTMSGPAIISLSAGVDFLKKEGIKKIAEHEQLLAHRFIEWLVCHKQFRVIAPDARRRTSVVSFLIEGIDCAKVAELLDRDYGICVRAGLHCAASAHRSLGSLSTGLVRVSFGYFNTDDQLDALLLALENILCMACK